MKRAAIYARVSTTRQKEEGSSLESQVATLSRVATERGYQVPPKLIFQEDRSGEDLERPELDELRTAAGEGRVSAVLVYSTDRLSRTPLHLLLLVEEFEKEGVELHFHQEPLDTSEEGKLIAYVKGYASKLEATRIRDRARRGLRVRAERGLMVGGYRLYGYRYIPGKEPGQGIRVVNEHEAEVVRRVFRWLVEEGMSTRAIAVRLQQEGIPAPGGGQVWYPGTLHRLLRREAYIGRTYTFRMRAVEPSRRRKTPQEIKQKRTAKTPRPQEEWVHLPGATPAIISEEVFMAAQEQLRRNAKNSPRNRKHSYLLSGHIKCACGSSMRGRFRHGQREGSWYIYYDCIRKGTEFGADRCRVRPVNGKHIEALVWHEVKKALSSPGAILASLEGRRSDTLDEGT